jgi:hypothetical protein
MNNDLRKEISQKYCPRFGQLAVELGFINETQLTEALARQVHEELSGEAHRLIGAILLEFKFMSASQIDMVMTELFKRMRLEHTDKGATP